MTMFTAAFQALDATPHRGCVRRACRSKFRSISPYIAMIESQSAVFAIGSLICDMFFLCCLDPASFFLVFYMYVNRICAYAAMYTGRKLLRAYYEKFYGVFGFQVCVCAKPGRRLHMSHKRC
jgi:hypothetical protein